MPDSAQRMSILDRLERGEINPQDAARLLSEEQKPAEKIKPATRMGILEQVERGELNADEAARQLLQAKSTSYRRAEREEKRSRKVSVRTVTSDSFSPARTWGWWLVPVGVGAVITLLSALWMRNDFADGRIGIAFILAWLPMAIGLLLIVVGSVARSSHWVHFEARSRKPGRPVNIKVKLPVPFGIAHAIVQGFGVHIPGMDRETIDRIHLALETVRENNEPIHIQTNSDDGEDALDVYIS